MRQRHDKNSDHSRGSTSAPGRSRIRGMRAPAEQPWKRDYDRQRDLPRLLPLLTEDLDAATPRAHSRLIVLLRRALRAERVRARSGHWTYDPARHAALLWAFRSECSAQRQCCRRRD